MQNNAFCGLSMLLDVTRHSCIPDGLRQKTTYRHAYVSSTINLSSSEIQSILLIEITQGRQVKHTNVGLCGQVAVIYRSKHSLLSILTTLDTTYMGPSILTIIDTTYVEPPF